MNAPAPRPVFPHPVRPEAFAATDTWVFDLDNTLYPAGSDLWPKIDARITAWMMARYGLDGLSARALQKFYYQRYGTTLRGLMTADGVDPKPFLAFVHDIDRSSIAADARLAAAIAALPGRHLIMTNGSRHHAEATAAALGLGGLFEDVFDILAADLVPKPERATYEKFVARYGFAPARAAMFEDIPRNLVVPKALGMTTVLVVPKPGVDDPREPFEIVPGPAPAHIDYVTSDLAGFLAEIRGKG